MSRDMTDKQKRVARHSRFMKYLVIAAPTAACAVAAAEAVLPGLREAMSPWVYAGASVVVSTLASILTRAAATAAAEASDD
jgi:predicted phage tail protein